MTSCTPHQHVASYLPHISAGVYAISTFISLSKHYSISSFPNPIFLLLLDNQYSPLQYFKYKACPPLTQTPSLGTAQLTGSMECLHSPFAVTRHDSISKYGFALSLKHISNSSIKSKQMSCNWKPSPSDPLKQTLTSFI